MGTEDAEAVAQRLLVEYRIAPSGETAGGPIPGAAGEEQQQLPPGATAAPPAAPPPAQPAQSHTPAVTQPEELQTAATERDDELIRALAAGGRPGDGIRAVPATSRDALPHARRARSRAAGVFGSMVAALGYSHSSIHAHGSNDSRSA